VDAPLDEPGFRCEVMLLFPACAYRGAGTKVRFRRGPARNEATTTATQPANLSVSGLDHIVSFSQLMSKAAIKSTFVETVSAAMELSQYHDDCTANSVML
jgi:hypothetical protein